MSWYSLSCELRRMILNTLITDESCVSCYASVSREWQYVMEKTTFKRLYLTPSRLLALDEMVHSRERLVEQIKFAIELPKLDCPYCPRDMPITWKETDEEDIEAGLQGFFSRLSDWSMSDSGLVIRIGIFPHYPDFIRYHDKDCVYNKRWSSDLWRSVFTAHRFLSGKAVAKMFLCQNRLWMDSSNKREEGGLGFWPSAGDWPFRGVLHPGSRDHMQSGGLY